MKEALDENQVSFSSIAVLFLPIQRIIESFN